MGCIILRFFALRKASITMEAFRAFGIRFPISPMFTDSYLGGKGKDSFACYTLVIHYLLGGKAA
jgi:hypothetical protein